MKEKPTVRVIIQWIVTDPDCAKTSLASERMRLSKAEAYRDWLISSLGISPERIVIEDGG